MSDEARHPVNYKVWEQSLERQFTFLRGTTSFLDGCIAQPTIATRVW